jgi:hypothetical protein
LAPTGAEKVAFVTSRFFEKISENKWPFFGLFLKEIPMLWDIFACPTKITNSLTFCREKTRKYSRFGQVFQRPLRGRSN